jgi:hypothetical protein
MILKIWVKVGENGWVKVREKLPPQVVDRSWKITDKFDASAEMIQKLEQKFAVSFNCADMSTVRTMDEFEARSKEIGWYVS